MVTRNTSNSDLSTEGALIIANIMVPYSEYRNNFIYRSVAYVGLLP